MKAFRLQDGIKLGVATASTQIEGGDKNNQWYEWTSSGKKTRDGTSSFKANQHWVNYKEDLLLMKEMGMQCYRFSLEWSRIEPEEGKFDQKAMDRYIQEIDLMVSYGIEPLVTLHHFSNPLWLEHSGGFLRKDSPKVFERYVEYVAKALKGRKVSYCTINEPNVYAVNCYLFGIWMPEVKSFSKAMKVLKNFGKAHLLAYGKIKEIDPEARVGFANHLQAFHPKTPHNPFYLLETKLYSHCFNDAITNAMAYGKFSFPIGFIGHKKGKFYDFIGINYYTRNEVSHFGYKASPLFPKNDLGWAIYPEGIRELAESYHKRYGGEIYITENGTADAKDAFRKEYVHDHLEMISGLPYVTRYYHWTFMDNFEWAEGESAKFGLVEYDYATGKKTIRPSGKYYSEVIRNRGDLG